MDLQAALQATAAAAPDPQNQHEKSEGWCWKLGGKRANWKKRWFQLHRNRIYYSETHGSHPINFILIDEGTTVAPQTEKLPKTARFGFLIKTSYTHRIYYLVCEHEDERNAWLGVLGRLIDRAVAQGTTHVNVGRHFAPPTLKERQPVLDVLVKGGQFALAASAAMAKVRVEVQLGRLVHRTFGIRAAKATTASRWNSDCTFADPAGVLEIRVTADKEVVGLVSLEEDLWTQYTAATTLRIDMHNTVSGYVEHSLLYFKGIPSKVIPFRLDAGDIIVFSSTHLLSYGTKLFTMSRWDHVALVVRWFNDKLRLIEAIDDGVKLFELDERLSLCNNAQLAARRLCADRSDEMLDKLHAFVGKVRGRPFKKDLLDLARAAGHFSTQEDMSSMFCSQLCAAAYQSLGLLAKTRPTTDFLPRDWAAKDSPLFVAAPNAPPWCLQRLAKYHVLKPRAASPSPRSSPRSHYTQRPASVMAEAPSAPVLVPPRSPRSGHQRIASSSSSSPASVSTPSASPSPSSSALFTQCSPRGASGAAMIGLERGGSGRVLAPTPESGCTTAAPSVDAAGRELSVDEAKREAVRRQTVDEAHRFRALPDLWAVLAEPTAQGNSTSPLRPLVTDASLAPMNVSLNV